MKYTYKRVLKYFLKISRKTFCNFIMDDELFNLYHTNKDVYKSLETLSAMHLITMEKDFEGYLFAIEITEAGITYIEELKDKHFRFWFPVIISLISLVGSFRQEIYCLVKFLCS